jgi:hypothetical protein
MECITAIKDWAFTTGTCQLCGFMCNAPHMFFIVNTTQLDTEIYSRLHIMCSKSPYKLTLQNQMFTVFILGDI